MSIVAEFIMKDGCLPRPEASNSHERLASQYVNSALERAHQSTATGPQLTLEQIAAWENCFVELPCQAHIPSWQEDPVLIAAQSFYDSYGHLNVHPQTPSAANGRTPLGRLRRLRAQFLGGGFIPARALHRAFAEILHW